MAVVSYRRDALWLAVVLALVLGWGIREYLLRRELVSLNQENWKMYRELRQEFNGSK